MAFTDALTKLNNKVSGRRSGASSTINSASNKLSSTLRQVDRIANTPTDIQNQINSTGSIINDKIDFANSISEKFGAFSLPTMPAIHDLTGLSDISGDASVSLSAKKAETVNAPTSSGNSIGTGGTNGAGGSSKPVVETIVAMVGLPMPQDISINYPKNWSGQNVGLVGGLLSAFRNGDANLSDAAKAVGSKMAGDNGLKKIMMDDAKISEKEHIKVMFQDIPFRTFSLSFKLFPKESGDPERIESMIKQMKLDSAPAADGFLWTYPKTYEVKVASGKNIMIYSKEAALIDISVNYTADGIWSQHADGYATATNLTLTYQDLLQPHKGNIAAGFII